MANLFNQTQQGAVTTSQKLQEIYDSISSLSDDFVKVSNTAADNVALVSSTEALAKSKAQTATLDLATKLGTNPDSATETMSALIADINTQYAASRQALEDIDRKRSTSLFESPMQWLQDNLTLSDSYQQYNSAADKYNLATTQLATLNNLTQESAITQNAIAQTKTIASAKAEAEVAKYEILRQQLPIQIQALQNNAQGMLQAQSLKEGMLNNQFQAQANARAEESMKMAREEAAARLEAIKVSKDSEGTYTNAVNLYRVANGMPALNQAQINVMRTTNAAAKVELDRQANGGLIINAQGATTPYLAASPTEAIEASQQITNIKPAQEKLLSWARDNFSQVYNNYKQPTGGYKLPPQAQLKQELDAFILNLAESQRTGVNTTKGNIYAPPPLSSLVTDPELKNLRAVEKVLVPAVDSGMKEFVPETVVPLLLNSVLKKEISYSEAVTAITALGNKSVQYNNAFYNYQSVMGLKNQANLNTSLPYYKFFFDEPPETRSMLLLAKSNKTPVFGPDIDNFKSSTLVDISDAKQVEAYINTYLGHKLSDTLKQQAIVNRKAGE